MGVRGVLTKNYFIYPETVAEYGTEIERVMTETDRAMEEASEIIAKMASVTERVPSQIRSGELLELCETAQAEIRSFDFLSYGKRVNQGLLNLLDQNQYITENFIKKMEATTERMREFGVGCRRLTELIDYSGGSLPLKGLALAAVSNTEDVSNNSQEIDFTRVELLRQMAAKLSGVSLNTYGEPIVNSAEEGERATAFYRYLEELKALDREGILRQLAARLSGASLNTYGEPIVNSAEEGERATAFYRYLEELASLDREKLLQQLAARLSGVSLNTYGEPIVNSAEEGERATAYYHLLVKYESASISEIVADIDSAFEPIEYIEAAELVQLATLNCFEYNWMKSPNVTYEFLNKVIYIADKLGVSPDDLMTVMAVESEFNPKCGDASSAVGLIQFVQSSIDNINQNNGTDYTKEDILAMDEFQQLDLVYLHCKGQENLDNLGDLYMALFCPRAVGKDDTYILYTQGTSEYEYNKVLDLNNDGYITREEVMIKVLEKRAQYV